MIDALPAVIEHHPNLLYVVLGATHPNLVAHEGEAYRDRLKALAEQHGVAGNMEFIDAFVDHDDLINYLQAADIYATPYTNPAQITSGTLSYAIGVGKAVVSTPYAHATEILADGHGVLVDFRDAKAFAREIDRLLSSDRDRTRLSGPGLCPRPDDDLAAPGRSGDRADPPGGGGQARAPAQDRRAAPAHPRYRRGRADERCDGHAAAFDLFDPRSAPRLLHRRQCPRADADECDRRSRSGAARQMDDDLCVVRPICVESRRPPVPQLHELRPHMVRGCRVGGLERPHPVGAGRHRPRCARPQAPRLGDGDVRPDRQHGVRTRQPPRAGVRDAGRRGDAGGPAAACPVVADPRALRRRAQGPARRNPPARMAVVRDRAGLRQCPPCPRR